MIGSFDKLRPYAVSAGAAVAGAIGVSLCCIGPLVLLALGLGSLHVIDALQPYRPWLIGGELVAYLAYRHFRPARTCNADSPPDAFKQVAFWLALLVILGALVGLAW